MAQDNSAFLKNLCQRWQLTTIEMKSTGHKFAPDEKMKQNYLQFSPDGIFESFENGLKIIGKWKADEMKMEIVTYDFDNQNLSSPVTFNIIVLTKNNLSISNNPVIEAEVIMHYVAKKASKKPKR